MIINKAISRNHHESDVNMENTKQLYILARQWTNANQKLLRKHKGQWIAYNGTDGIIAHDKDASKVIQTARASGIEHIIKYLNAYTYGGLRRLVSIRFRSLHLNTWEPNTFVQIQVKDKKLKLEMLVDSGADISTLPFSIGEQLGLVRYENEVVDLAAGVNGTIEYVLRNIEMTIKGHTFKVPVAWFLDPSCDDILLGREVVFDIFDIEFKQKDKLILFKKRTEEDTIS